MLDLRDEFERGQVPLLVANMPGASFNGAAGRYLFGQLCLAAQLQRDLDSERMTRMLRGLFEDGRHRGHDPFGYRSQRDGSGHLVHPRQLVAVPEEADGRPSRLAGAGDRGRSSRWPRSREREGLPHRGRGLDARRRQGHPPTGSLLPRQRRREARPRERPDSTSRFAEAEYPRQAAAITTRTRPDNKPQPVPALPAPRPRELRPAAPGCAAKPTSSAAGTSATTAVRPRLPGARFPADLPRRRCSPRSERVVLPEPVVEAARAELRRRLATPAAASGPPAGRLQTRLE